MVKEKRTLLDMVKKRTLEYFGHLIRADGMQKVLLEGKVGEKKASWCAKKDSDERHENLDLFKLC